MQELINIIPMLKLGKKEVDVLDRVRLMVSLLHGRWTQSGLVET